MKSSKKILELIFGILTITAFVIVILLYQRPTADSGLKIEFLDVGQGDAIYIKTVSGQDILIDGGPDNSVLAGLGKVMDLSDREINLVILSHPHADHLTGLVEVLQRYKVDEVWETGVAYPSATYDEFEKEIQTKNIPEKFVRAGDEKNFGETKISILYPLLELKNQKIDNLNNSSIVARLNYLNFTALFPGDLEKDAQAKVPTENLFSTILKVPHHGSQNGLSESFLKAVRPAVAVISVGKDNKFGHPHEATLNLLKQLAIKYYRTDQDGRIEIITSGQGYAVNTFPSE
jgi:competence protein ComEC